MDEGAKPHPTPRLPCGSLGAGQWEPVGDWGQAIGRLGARDQLYTKSILGDYFQENRTSPRPFLLLRIRFPGRPIFIQLPPGISSEMVKMTVKLLPLRMLAMERCRHIFDTDDDPRLRGSGLPIQLKNELDDYRRRIDEGYWICREAGCLPWSAAPHCQQNME